MSKKYEEFTAHNGIAFAVSSDNDVSIVDMMVSVYDRKKYITITKQQVMNFFGLGWFDINSNTPTDRTNVIIENESGEKFIAYLEEGEYFTAYSGDWISDVVRWMSLPE